MEKGLINIKVIVLSVLLLGIITSAGLLIKQKPGVLSSIAPTAPVKQRIQNKSLTYKGESGKDALTLLKQETVIEQDGSGMVSVINGYKADQKAREYWAFYINGKSADVGPADYQTKDSDIIGWKIEKY